MNQLQMNELSMLDEVETTTEEVNERFEVTDLQSANWVFKKISALNTRVEEKKALATDEHIRIDEWLSKETETDTQSIEYFNSLLIEYYRQLRELDPKAKLTTPYGKVTSRKMQPKWEFNEDEAIEYFKVNHPEIIAVKESVNKTEAKKFLQPMNDEYGRVVDENGEIVLFAIARPQGESYTVKPE